MERKKFFEGEEVQLVYTGEVRKIRKVVKAAYWCYYLEGEDGYRVDIDLRKIKKGI